MPRGRPKKVVQIETLDKCSLKNRCSHPYMCCHDCNDKECWMRCHDPRDECTYKCSQTFIDKRFTFQPWVFDTDKYNDPKYKEKVAKRIQENRDMISNMYRGKKKQ